jgi:hypothetical protein
MIDETQARFAYAMNCNTIAEIEYREKEFNAWLQKVRAEAVSEFIDETGVAVDGVRPMLAKAWDEGYDERERGGMVDWNPYREKTK